MRATFLLVAGAILAGPATAGAQAGDNTPFFLRPPPPTSEALRAYSHAPYRPVRPDEVRSAGFLTEGRMLAYGTALGGVEPPHVRATLQIAPNEVGAVFAVQPPAGGTYAVGDTLVVATRTRGPSQWGEVIQPTGLLVVTEIGSRQTLTRVLKIYGPIRDGQVVLPVAPVPHPGAAQPVATPQGPSGMVIAQPGIIGLVTPGEQMFTNLGSDAGMHVGDFVQVRRPVKARSNAPDTVGEVMATAQVVAVNAGSSTIKLINVTAPDIPSGTPVVRVATLPN